jgi:ketosteroid isomerase-like protein
MHKHPNEERIAALYDHFAKGEFDAVLAMCSDDITFEVPGRTPFSGVHTKADFKDWIGKVWSISEGTFREVPERIVANDHHGVALLDHFLSRGGREIQYRTNHIWEIRDGIFTHWEEWPGDEEIFTLAWS